jgi:hypothetical protein
MDTSAIISALAAVLGSLVGGSATVATAWLTQKTSGKRELLRMEIPKREALYGEFISECSKLFLDALSNSLESPEKLLGAFSTLNRIRLAASPDVLAEAEGVLQRITEQYFAKELTLDQMRELTHSSAADPLKPFGETCRRELLSLRATV